MFFRYKKLSKQIRRISLKKMFALHNMHKNLRRRIKMDLLGFNPKLIFHREVEEQVQPGELEPEI
jgi:hypothetical protein